MDNISLIDWGSLAANALWVVGLALALASLSFAYFEASSNQVRLGAILQQRRFDLTLNLAGILFCAGLAATSRQILEITLWVVLVILFLISMLISLHKRLPQ